MKPENVMLCDDGVSKILDFGIAIEAQKSKGKEGMVIGSFFYMSPEQLTAQELDFRSDMYSAGLMFLEMLIGDHPRKGCSSPCAMAFLAVTTEEVSEGILARVPESVRPIIRKMSSPRVSIQTIRHLPFRIHQLCGP